MNWKEAVSNIKTRRANIFIIGDSITEGAWASTYYESWIHKVREYLQSNLLPSGRGIGYIPAIRGFDGAGNAGFTESNGDQWEFTDTSQIDRSSSNIYGFGRRGIKIPQGNTAKISFTGDKFQIMYSGYSNSGILSIKVNTEEVASIDTSQPSLKSGLMYTSATLSKGTYGIEITAKTGDVILDGGCFFSENFDKGITVWDSAHTGFTTANFDGHDSGSARWADGIAAVSPDAVIISLGTNDAALSQVGANTSEGYKNRLASIVDLVRSKSPDSSVYLTLQPQPGYSPNENPKSLWDEYLEAGRAVSLQKNAGIIDLTQKIPSGRNNLGELSPYYHNSNHPNSTGMRMYASAISRFLSLEAEEVPPESRRRKMKYFNGESWSSQNDFTANVKDFGAVGNGIAVETTAFTDAMRSIKNEGGGTLLIPPGQYHLPTHIQLCSNLVIKGEGAVLLKKKDTPRPSYAFFSALSQGEIGYGGGVRNVRVSGLTFRGDFENNINVCGFALHHGQDIVIEDCHFIECQGTGHCIDMGGCKGVSIRRCRFLGFNQNSTDGYSRAECIQFDNSTPGGLSVTDSVGSFDGLPTVDVVIEECSFEELTVGTTWYPAPNPMGSHSSIEGARASNIVFRGNTVGSIIENTTTTWRGGIHFPGVLNLTIEGNRFYNNRNSRVIALYNEDMVTPKTADFNSGSLPAKTNVGTEPLLVENVVIRNNQFIQKNTVTSSYQEVIFIDGTPGGITNNSSSLRANNIEISHNEFVLDMQAGEMIRIEGGTNINILSNRGRNVHMAVVVRPGEGILSQGNYWEGSPRTPQSFNGQALEQYSWSTGVTVKDNYYINPLDHAVWVGNACLGIQIQNLDITGVSNPSTSRGDAISVTGKSDNFIVSGCRIKTSLSTPTKAMTIGTDTVENSGFVINNIAQGYPGLLNESAIPTNLLVIKDNIVK